MYGLEMADPLCVKLNDLICRVKIENQIFYKYFTNIYLTLLKFVMTPSTNTTEM